MPQQPIDGEGPCALYMTEVIMRVIKTKPRTKPNDIDEGLDEFCKRISFTLEDAHGSRHRFANKLKQRLILSPMYVVTNV